MSRHIVNMNSFKHMDMLRGLSGEYHPNMADSSHRTDEVRENR